MKQAVDNPQTAASQILHPIDDVSDLESSIHPVIDVMKMARGRTIVSGYGTVFEGLRLPDFFGSDPKAASFAVLSFDGCQRVLAEARTFSSDFWPKEYTDTVGRSLFAMDPPEHSSFRTLIQAGFTPRVVSGWDDEIIVPAITRAFDDFVSCGRADIASDIALRFPYEITALILGFPLSDLEFVSDRITKMSRSNYDREAGFAASKEMHAYVKDYIAEKRVNLTDDFISTLLRVEVAGERLSDAQLLAFIFHVFPAGMETTFRGASNLTWLLLSNPEELEKMRADRNLVPAAIAEMLRFEGPASMFPRKALVDTEIDGVAIPAGAMVYAMMAAANRDPSRWERPDAFEIDRPAYANLGFGYGPHACIGMHLARKELEIFANMLCDRMPNLRRDPVVQDVPQIVGWTLRSALSVPAVWDIPAH